MGIAQRNPKQRDSSPILQKSVKSSKIKMPENTEVLNKKDEVAAPDVEKDSGTDSDSADSIPELEETGAGGAQTQGANPLAAAAGITEDMVSKAKQSRGEKKARKIMSKLGLKQVAVYPESPFARARTSFSSSTNPTFTRTLLVILTLFSVKLRLKTCPNKLKLMLQRNSTPPKHPNLPKWVVLELLPPPEVNPPFPKMMKMKKSTRRELRATTLTWLCPKPMYPDPKRLKR